MTDVIKDKLIQELFEALDDEVLHEATLRHSDVSEKSIEILKTCERLRIGRSEALKKIHKNYLADKGENE